VSAECHIHGCDLVYPEGSWPVGVCDICESEDVIGKLRRERDRYKAALHEIADGPNRHDPVQSIKKAKRALNAPASPRLEPRMED
jgi:hypothetical protein